MIHSTEQSRSSVIHLPYKLIQNIKKIAETENGRLEHVPHSPLPKHCTNMAERLTGYLSQSSLVLG